MTSIEMAGRQNEIGSMIYCTILIRENFPLSPLADFLQSNFAFPSDIHPASGRNKSSEIRKKRREREETDRETEREKEREREREREREKRQRGYVRWSWPK